MRHRDRIIVAILIGLASGVLSFVLLAERGYQASDFTYPWRAARALLAGADPYAAIQPAGPYPFEGYFYYPLPAALVTLPLATLPPYAAGALFFGLAATALAYVVTAQGWDGLLLFTAAPFFVACAVAQWSPLIVAAALAPGFQWMLVCKPHLTLVSFAYRPSRLGIALAAALALVSLVVMPRWPLEWLQAVRHSTAYWPPPALILPLGPPLLLSALRWRNREARHLLLLSICPQFLFFYDQFPLWLIPQGWRKKLVLSLCSWIALLTWRAITGDLTRGFLWISLEKMNTAVGMAIPLLYLFIFYPALVMVLVPPVRAGLARLWPHGPRKAP